MSTDAHLSPPQSPALATLVERGFVEQISDPQAVDEALARGRVTFYIGYDPTASSLHVGNLVCLMAMRWLQKFGHRPIVLVGGGTARVGDPSGRTETRRVMEEETIDRNVDAIQGQMSRFLQFDAHDPCGAVLMNNAVWLSGLRYIEFLRDIGVHFTVNRMIATKTYRERLDQELPLSFFEFNYQLLQAYDFLHLYREHGCTMQLGGSDQWGNMIAGVELIRRVGERKHGLAQCLTFPLLTTADGRKMGKTERGAVWLDAEQVSPFEYYQYFIGCDDRDVQRLLLLFTELSVDEISAVCGVEGAALRSAKARLAFEATRIAHGDEAAQRAQTASEQAFGGSQDWSAVPGVVVDAPTMKLIDLVVNPGVAAFTSKRQARQRIEAGAVRVDDEIVRDPEHELCEADLPAGELRLQVGKKKRYRVVFGASS